MIVFREDEAHQIFEIRIEGKITDEALRPCIQALEAMIERFGKVKILEEIVSFEGMELHALWDELKFELHHWNHFSHCAVVTDKQWLNDAAKLVAPIAGIKIRVFKYEHRDEARRWLQLPE